MDNDDFKTKLVKLLTLFKNRPNHLAKYLTDNNAFNKTFINKVIKSNPSKDDVYLESISDMDECYNSILDNIKNIKNPLEIEDELNSRMKQLIDNEKYEEAARLRDYMLKNLIKRNKR